MSGPQPGWYPDPNEPGGKRWWNGAAWTGHIESDGASDAPPRPHAAPTRRLPVWTRVLIAVLAVGAVVVLAPVAAPVALVVMITAIVAWKTGTRTWLRIRSRRAAASLTALAAAALLVAGGVSATAVSSGAHNVTAVDASEANAADRIVGKPSPASGASPAAEPTSTTKPTPTSTPTPTPTPTFREVTVTEVVPFEDTTVDDPNLPIGQSRVTQEGQNGERALTYRITEVDGQEVERSVISDVVTVEPIERVTAVGSYEAPPPPAPEPAPAPVQGSGDGCDSNYADACVPISSDVDCAAGSGNGPAYFGGVARIVGSDIYDLDRDGDGYACEP